MKLSEFGRTLIKKFGNCYYMINKKIVQYEEESKMKKEKTVNIETEKPMTYKKIVKNIRSQCTPVKFYISSDEPN